LLNAANAPGQNDATELARRILDATGVQGGLIVHVGCGDGKLTSALHAGDNYLVHGLDSDLQDVDSARKFIRSLGKYGPVSVDSFGGKHLPYVDNLVNLVVASGKWQVAGEEVNRVLAPGGVALALDSRLSTPDLLRKPWPDEIDDWTHWLHDASGNAVAQDLAVGPPRHYQWTARPAWSSHHDTVLSTSAMVTSGGRVFAIVNEAPLSEFHEASQGKWFLTARDAFNGVLLWKVPMDPWGWQTWGESFTKRFAQPVQLPSRLVAQGDQVYVTLGFHAPVSVLDAATGDVLKTHQDTNSADEILLHDGKLIVTVYDPKNEPSAKTIRAIDRETGAIVWESGPHVGLPARYDAVENWAPVYVTAHQRRVVFVSKGHIVCLDLDSGNPRWRKPRPEYHEHRMHLGVRQSENCTLVNHQDVVLFVQPVGRLPHTNHTVPCDLYALSAKSGETLWRAKCGTWAWGHQADVFVIGDLVWIHQHIPTEMQGPSPVGLDSLNHALLGLDLRTGEIKKRIPTDDIFRIGHHHRCYRNKATTKYVFTARRGTETTDLDSGHLLLHPWLRSECRFGIVLGNGLVYTAPHPCACYAGVSLTGFNALAGGSRAEGPESRAEPKEPRAESGEQRARNRASQARLERGPAYDESVLPPSAFRPPPSIDWPTYRGNGQRSGFVPARLEGGLETKWRCNLNAPLSAVTVSGGAVYVAEKDRHTVVSLEADSGQVRWRFTAGGRVDSPPTVTRGKVVFGSVDGWVYCLTAAYGKLTWRFRAAPRDLRMVADSQVESVWPVHGSVLVRDGQVLAVAGRTTYLDGGLYAYRLDLETGRVIEEKRVSHEHLTDRKELATKATRYDHYNTDGAVTDLLAAQGNSVFLKKTAIFGDGGQDGPLLATHSGFLDDSMFERSFWYVVRPSQQSIGAQLMVHDETAAYGFRAYASAGRGGPWHVIGSGYTLFAASLSAPKGLPKSPSSPHVPDFSLKPFRDFTWQVKVPVRARAMVLADNVLLLAGSPDMVQEGTDPYAAVEGKLGGKLLMIRREDGKTIAEYTLDSVPVWDGMAVADGRVFEAMQDGSIVCMFSAR
jgi:outer membrane protein assembly factor BamB